jgi:hypothetical protein
LPRYVRVGLLNYARIDIRLVFSDPWRRLTEQVARIERKRKSGMTQAARPPRMSLRSIRATRRAHLPIPQSLHNSSSAAFMRSAAAA